MIILRTPKGWTGPKVVDGKQVEGTYRAHQVPSPRYARIRNHLKQLEEWMRGYKPEELFDSGGKLIAELANLAPKGDRRMSANPHANGGLLLRGLMMPDFREYAVEVFQTRNADRGSDARARKTPPRRHEDELKQLLGDGTGRKQFRIASRLSSRSPTRCPPVLSSRAMTISVRMGRVMEVLSEHMCQGWLEGYLLTGRHGFFSCYEAFIHIVDSMFNQHAKWLESSLKIPWRRPIASLN